MAKITSRRAALCAVAALSGGKAAALEPWPSWADSYSAGGRCYCDTSYDHGVGRLLVDTPQGPKSVVEVCELIGPGPGAAGNPLYNDVQCGHGPPNDVGDEQVCPGRVDIGEAGCGVLGPSWDLEALFPPPPAPGIDPAEADAGLEAGGVPIAGLIAFEAEDAFAADGRWVRIGPDAGSPFGPGGPDNPDDPDAAHTAGASGGAYLEVLPDAQPDAGAPAPEGGAWLVPGTGPRLQYAVDFPSPGAWRVRVRTHPTNGRDTTLWVGVDGRFDPVTGLVEACPERGAWAWTACGADAVLEIDAAGGHTVEIAARDDGVELDRVALSPLPGDAAAPQPVEPAITDASGADPGEGGPTVDEVAGPPAVDGVAAPPTVAPAPNAPELGRAVTVGGGLAPGVAAASGPALALAATALGLRALLRRRPRSRRR